jgi:hypothetical protein
MPSTDRAIRVCAPKLLLQRWSRGTGSRARPNRARMAFGIRRARKSWDPVTSICPTTLKAEANANMFTRRWRRTISGSTLAIPSEASCSIQAGKYTLVGLWPRMRSCSVVIVSPYCVRSTRGRTSRAGGLRNKGSPRHKTTANSAAGYPPPMGGRRDAHSQQRSVFMQRPT